MSAAAIIVGERCHYCSKFCSPLELLKIGDSALQCVRCHQKHIEALAVLAGNPPECCGECRVTFEQLGERTAGEQVSMFIHLKDGIYQLLCRACDLKYVAQRKDLYGATAFGRSRGLV